MPRRAYPHFRALGHPIPANHVRRKDNLHPFFFRQLQQLCGDIFCVMLQGSATCPPAESPEEGDRDHGAEEDAIAFLAGDEGLEKRVPSGKLAPSDL
jgi:hypothetical protein